MAEMINVLVVEPQKAPYMKEIESSLESLQKEVGGYIESTYPWVDPVALIVNEEGKLEGLPYNRALRDEDGDVYDVVAGTFMIVGLGEEDFSSLDEKYQQKYGELFGTPERFIPINGGLCVVPMEESIPQIPEKQHKPKQKSHDREAR